MPYFLLIQMSIVMFQAIYIDFFYLKAILYKEYLKVLIFSLFLFIFLVVQNDQI